MQSQSVVRYLALTHIDVRTRAQTNQSWTTVPHLHARMMMIWKRRGKNRTQRSSNLSLCLVSGWHHYPVARNAVAAWNVASCPDRGDSVSRTFCKERRAVETRYNPRWKGFLESSRPIVTITSRATRVERNACPLKQAKDSH